MSKIEVTADAIAEAISRCESLFQPVKDAVEEAAKTVSSAEPEYVVRILETCFASLKDASEQGRLLTMPQTVLTELRDALANVQTSMESVSSDPAQFKSLANFAGTLFDRVWRFRLIEPARQVEAYEASVGYLTSLIESAKEKHAQLDQGLESKKRIDEASRILEEQQASAMKLHEEIQKAASDSQTATNAVTGTQTTIQKLAAELGALKKASDGHAQHVATRRKDIDKWHGEIEANRTKLTEIQNDTETTLAEHDRDIEGRRAKLDDFQERIEEQFERAASGALSTSFEERRTEIQKRKAMWLYIGGASGLILFGLGLLLLRTLGDPKPGDYLPITLKILTGLPFLFVLIFAAAQFGKERRLEEAYGFKSSVALSFGSYRKMVAEVVADPQMKDTRYGDFIMATVASVYYPPDGFLGAKKPEKEQDALGRLLEALRTAESISKRLKT